RFICEWRAELMQTTPALVSNDESKLGFILHFRARWLAARHTSTCRPLIPLSGNKYIRTIPLPSRLPPPPLRNALRFPAPWSRVAPLCVALALAPACRRALRPRRSDASVALSGIVRRTLLANGLFRTDGRSRRSRTLQELPLAGRPASL